MIDFSWKVFSLTGNIDTYLLMKELEKQYNSINETNKQEEDHAEIDAH